MKELSEGDNFEDSQEPKRARLSDKEVLDKTGKSMGEWKRILEKEGINKVGPNEVIKKIQGKYNLDRWTAGQIATKYESEI